MSINHIKLIYYLLYMINVAHHHATINILDVKSVKIYFS